MVSDYSHPVCFLPSGNTSNVGKLYTAYREADDARAGIKLLQKIGNHYILLFLTSKIPLKKKMV
jgi:hypothetical protein